MAQLQIYNPDGTLYTTVNIGADTVCNMDLMGQNKISANIVSPVSLKFRYNMYINENGNQYRLKEIPKRIKTGMRLFNYAAVFEGREYVLHNKQMKRGRGLKFSYYGNLRSHLQLIIDNANEIDPGWVIGNVDDSTLKIMEYDKTSCRDAITKLAELFEVEYEFKGRNISMKATVGGVIKDVVLKFGKNNGLKSVTVEPAGDSEFATVFYGIGSSDNLPDTYRQGTENLTFDPGYAQVNVDLYGVIESTIEFPEIKPEREAAITGLTALVNEVVDTTIDFNLRDQMVDGQAQIVFTTGALGGKEFEITNYNPTTKVIRFNTITEKNGAIYPNATTKAKVGDKYVLVGIEMPQSYITNAEARLATKLNEYAVRNSHPPVQVSFDTDELFIREHNLVGAISIGDKLNTLDTDLDVSQLLRVNSLSYPIANPSAISFKLSDKIQYTQSAKAIVDKKQQETALKELDQKSYEDQRTNAIRRRELQGMIFDPDGLFDGSIIKPNSITTLSLVVGARSQEFTLEMLFRPNYKKDPNAFAFVDGRLIHLTIDPAGVKTWQITANILYNLAPATAYYLYARCPRNGSAGTMVLDTAQRKFDSDSTYWYFLVGVLSTTINGVRVLSLTYGATETNGRFLTTGRIQSQDGKTYFDLDEGVISGQIKFVSGDGSIKDVTALETEIKNIQPSTPNLLSYRPANHENGYYNVNSGAPVYLASAIRSKGNFAVKSNQQYTLSCADGASLVLLELNAAGVYLNSYRVSSDNKENTFTTSANTKFVSYYAQTNPVRNITPEYARTLRAQLQEGSKRLPWTQSPQDIFEDINDDSLGNDLGRNFFRTDSALTPYRVSVLAYHSLYAPYNNMPSDYQQYDNGLFITGDPSGDLSSNARVNNAITGNGFWTVSFIVRSNGAFQLNVDICDGVVQKVDVNTIWKKVVMTFEVTNYTANIYNFLDFGAIPYNYLYIGNLMVEKGKVAHEWTEAPEDTARKIAEAKKRLDDMAADGLLTPVEKLQARKDYLVITKEYPSLLAEGNRYEHGTASLTNEYNFLTQYLSPLFADMTSTSVVSRQTFNDVFSVYYDAAQRLSNNISAKQKAWSGGRNYGSGRQMLLDPEFATSFNRLNVYNNLGDGTVSIARQTSAWYGAKVPNNSGYAVAVTTNNSGSFSRPGRGGVSIGNEMSPNSVYIYRLLALLPAANGIQWAANDLGAGSTVVWNTPQISSGGWQEYIVTVTCGNPHTPTVGDAGYFYMDGTEGGGFHIASFQYYDMTNYKNPNREDINDVTIFKNFFSFQVRAAGAAGYAVFKTKIPAANNMCTMTIKGFNYEDVSTNIDVQIGFYTNSPDNAGATSFSRMTMSSKGDCVVDRCWIGKSADGYVWILLRNTKNIWQYPSFTVETLQTSFSPTSLNIEQGWRGAVTEDWPQGEAYVFMNAAATVVGESTAGANQKVLQLKSEAATDAQNKADAAQRAAALDATGKSNAAAEESKAYARQQRQELANQLKITAYQDIKDWAIRDGVTMVQGGFINTVAIDAISLRSVMITADFISSTIVTAGTVNAVNINAGSIQSGTIDSARINADTLVAKNIKTATSGQRAEITAATNEMRFYAAGVTPEIVRIGAAAQSNGNVGYNDSGLVVQVTRPNGVSIAASNVTANGIFSNGGLMPMASSTSGFYTVGSVGGLLQSKDVSSRTAAGVFIQDNGLWGVAECHALYTVGDRCHSGAEYFDPETSFVTISANSPNYSVGASVRIARFTGVNQGSGNIYLPLGKKGRLVTMCRDGGGNAIAVRDSNSNLISNLGIATLNFYHNGSGWFAF